MPLLALLCRLENTQLKEEKLIFKELKYWIELLKIQKERELLCPETINQAGFSKGAMTVDHVLTLHTIVEKYKKRKQPVYGAFIDFRKAFDTIWRDGLMLKLAQLGIDSSLMKSIKEYYTDRTASIKVGGCITDTFPTKAGVIQGEPPSPELFKIFIYELSDHLDEAYNDVPYLNGRKVSHLLWADDLFINALTSEGLQILLDTLHEFCIDWGLTPNPIKCNVIIFNKAYIRDPSDQKFILGTSEIEIATSYTYLGLELTDSASLKHAMEIISRKGRRAMGALMSALDRKIVSPPIAIKLFKSLVQPILLYGAQLYCPLVAAKEILGLDTPCLSSYFNNHSSFGPEATHLRFVKWVLGVHKKTMNVFCWSEVGEFPLMFDALRLALSYYRRVELASENTLVAHAFAEQKELGLKWYTTMSKLVSRNKDLNGQLVKDLKLNFIYLCKIYKMCHSKPEFLLSMDSKFGFQFYLQCVNDFDTRKCISKLRSSSHCLEIETARYTNPKTPREERFCSACRSMGIEIVETEQHFLRDCPFYEVIRQEIYKLVSQARGGPLSFISNSKDGHLISTVGRVKQG